jgi:hypothetical protein
MKLSTVLSCLCVIIFAFTSKNSKVLFGIQKVKNNYKEIIKATLTNKTNDTLYYYSMSCSWQEFYSTDNTNLIVHVNLCDKNIPKVLQIAPHKSNVVTLELINKLTNKNIGKKLRIGFNFIEPKSRNLIDFNRKELTNKVNIIWSNTICL